MMGLRSCFDRLRRKKTPEKSDPKTASLQNRNNRLLSLPVELKIAVFTRLLADSTDISVASLQLARSVCKDFRNFIDEHAAYLLKSRTRALRVQICRDVEFIYGKGDDEFLRQLLQHLKYHEIFVGGSMSWYNRRRFEDAFVRCWMYGRTGSDYTWKFRMSWIWVARVLRKQCMLRPKQKTRNAAVKYRLQTSLYLLHASRRLNLDAYLNGSTHQTDQHWHSEIWDQPRFSFLGDLVEEKASAMTKVFRFDGSRRKAEYDLSGPGNMSAGKKRVDNPRVLFDVQKVLAIPRLPYSRVGTFAVYSKWALERVRAAMCGEEVLSPIVKAAVLEEVHIGGLNSWTRPCE